MEKKLKTHVRSATKNVSPTTYQVEKSLERTTLKVMNKQGLNWSFDKQPRFKLGSRSTKSLMPAVGKYQSHTALDKVARPMRKRI